MKTKWMLLLSALLLFPWGQASGEEAIGALRKVVGSAFIERNGERITAENGIFVKINDVIRTGKDGSLGIVFKDNTRLAIGPETELTLTRYLFEPAQNRFDFLTRIVKGTATYISGSIGKLAPDSVTIETPTATIGIRGTRLCAKVSNP